MEQTEKFRQHARAMLSGNGPEAQRLREDFSQEDHGAHFMFIGALFTQIARRHFGAALEPEKLQGFMGEIRDDFQSANPPLNSMHVEGVIRAIYGESHFIDEIPAGDQSIAMWAVMRKITDQTVLGQHLDQLFSEAEKLADKWIAQAT